MTCSRPQRNVHRPGFEPGTPWSEIRCPNHCATRHPRDRPSILTLFVLGQFKLAFKLSTSSLMCCFTVREFITIKSQFNLPFSLRKEHHLYIHSTKLILKYVSFSCTFIPISATVKLVSLLFLMIMKIPLFEIY